MDSVVPSNMSQSCAETVLQHWLLLSQAESLVPSCPVVTSAHTCQHNVPRAPKKEK